MKSCLSPVTRHVALAAVASLAALSACATSTAGSEVDARPLLPEDAPAATDADPGAPDANPGASDAGPADAASDATTGVDAMSNGDATTGVDAMSNGDAAPVPDASAGPDAMPIPPQVLGVTPSDSSVAGGGPVTVMGQNFTADVAITLGANPAVCTFTSPTSLTCTVPTAAIAGLVSVTATQSSGAHSLFQGFLYWDAISEVDACDVRSPTAVDDLALSGHIWKAQVIEPGVTNVTTGNDPALGFLAQYGYGPAGSDPTTHPGWRWVDASVSPGYGPAAPGYRAGYDEYIYDGLLPARGQYAWSFRFSVEAGVHWRVCNTGTTTARAAIPCSADPACFADERCLGGSCRLPCTTSAECRSWAPQCSGLASHTELSTPLHLYCRAGGSGSATLGDDCSANSDCGSGLCLTGLSNTCTIGCGVNDGICGVSAGRLCSDFGSFDVVGEADHPLGLCTPSCERNADCAIDQLCMSKQNGPQNRYDQICLESSAGTDPPGSNCSVTNNCNTGMCLIVSAGVTEVCSAICTTNADCPTAVPSCSGATIDLPDGTGTQVIMLCGP